MTNTQIAIARDEFDSRYPLVPNHLNPHAGWAHGEERGCLFETYGKELDFVRQQHPGTVWTLVDGDDGDQYLSSGLHFVNRIGYLVSTVAIPEGAAMEVRIPVQKHINDEHRSVAPGEERVPAALTTALIVLKGTPLVPGKMYLRLYHGRTDPDQEMDDWGFDGPTFGPLASCVQTYCTTFRIHAESGTDEIWLKFHDDMIWWNDCYYGDKEVFVARAQQTA